MASQNYTFFETRGGTLGRMSEESQMPEVHGPRGWMAHPDLDTIHDIYPLEPEAAAEMLPDGSDAGELQAPAQEPARRSSAAS